MIVWIGSTARTGGTVLYNIAAGLIVASGNDIQAIDNKDLIAAFDMTTSPPCPTQALGKLLNGGIAIGRGGSFYSDIFQHPSCRVVFVKRDIREAAASMKLLNKSTYEQVTKMIRGWYKIHLQYKDLPDDRCLRLDYCELSNLAAVTRKIADYLNLAVSDDDCQNIADKNDRNSLKTQFQKRADDFMQRLQACGDEADRAGCLLIPIVQNNQETAARIPVSYLSEETARVLENQETIYKLDVLLPDFEPVALTPNNDGRTFRINFPPQADKGFHINFQSEHVSRPENSKWQSVFSAQEVQDLEELYRPMKETLGY